MDHTLHIFRGPVRIMSGKLAEIWDALETERAYTPHDLLAFSAETGRVVDLPVSRPISAREETQNEVEQPARRGRPKLGVVSREITLLPRHWDWLASQRGGASATLRRLIDDARKASDATTSLRQRQTAAYTFMNAMAGNFPGYEEALRSLYRNDEADFRAKIMNWPRDIRDTALCYAYP
ncbi:MAG: hypothetical protein CMK07_11100 [Ponticaulis sp.]|nr:hypothetical protein [Ponticaulis sp.]